METKEFKIQAPEGYEIDKGNSTFEKIVFKRKELPKSWEDLMTVKGYCVSTYSKIEDCSEEFYTYKENKNIFPTKEEAEACLALAQLCQLRDRYNDGWKPDWEYEEEVKFNIFYSRNSIVKSTCYMSNTVLVFKTEELRDKFLENFRDLIEVAKPLL